MKRDRLQQLRPERIHRLIEIACGFVEFRNLVDGQELPGMVIARMVTVFVESTKDDRVHPGHARKMTAALEALGQPVLYYENIEGGHGGAADAKQSAFMTTLAYDFMFETLSKNAEAMD